MTRHSRNCTAGAVYSYHEKKKDTEASGWGTEKARFSKDSMQEFDCCNLSLQPCKDPVITPDGYLYEREAIIEYMIQQKRLISKKLKDYERQKGKEEVEQKRLLEEKKDERVKEFMKQEGSIISRPLDPFKSSSLALIKPAGGKKATTTTTTTDEPQPGPSNAGAISNMSGENKTNLPAFWVPSLTPDDKGTVVKKPDTKVVCPMTKKPLAMKHLITVKFTKVNDGDDKTHVLNKQLRYVCAVTGDALGNSVPCAVLRHSGAVVTQESVEKILKLDDPMRDPITAQVMTNKDIIYMQRGASSFAASGLILEAANARPVMSA